MAEPFSEESNLRMQSFEAGGFGPLLPQTGSDRWLCMDSSGGSLGALVAGLCSGVEIVGAHPGDAAAIEARLGALRVRNARVHQSFPPPAAMPRLDGFILHDLHGKLGPREVQLAIEAALPLVGPNGFLYVALRNRFGYPRLRRPWGRGHYFRPSELARFGAGRASNTHPVIANAQGRVVEVIGREGYVCAKNPTQAGEQLRRALLGPTGAHIFSPGFAWIARAAGGAPTIIESTMQRMESEGLLRAGEGRMKRYYVLTGGKVIVSMGDSADPFGRFVFVYARDVDNIERRKREFRHLRQLATLPDIARHVPHPCFHDALPGGHGFVMQEIRGVTLDAHVPILAKATREAADFLVRLHRATVRVERFTPERFAVQCEPLFDEARRRYPVLAAPFARLREATKSGLVGSELPIVWMHGDFKIENVVVDARGELVGVIDWDLTEPEGLPLVDLAYLKTYNRHIRHGEDFFVAVRRLFRARDPEAAEEALWKEYLRLLAIPADAYPSLVAMFVVHHFARRLMYNPHKADWMRKIESLVEELAQWVGQGGARTGD